MAGHEMIPNTIEWQKSTLEREEGLGVGERVVIQDGPLAGLQGSFVEARATRVVLSVQLLRTMALIELDQAWVRRVSETEIPGG